MAEYRYNGLNQRIAWHYDVDADNDVDTNDNWFYFVHDDKWRIVATFRGNGGGTTVESDPKERFVYHMAGLGGYGGSSYIDSVILRDRDNTSGWNSSSDGTLEERRYYIQNWRADVVAILTDTGAMVERIKYSAYGVPFNLPMGDTDGNGVTNSTDVAQIVTWTGAGTWSALGDTDLDGDVDAADSTNAGNNLITTGRGVLSYSAVGSRIGYAGYQHAPELAGSKWHVRNRFFNSDTGRWNTRDPLGYVDGSNLYQYAQSMTIRRIDAMGTVSATFPPAPEDDDDPSTPPRWEGSPCKQSEKPIPDRRGFVGDNGWQVVDQDCKERCDRQQPPLQGVTGCTDGVRTHCCVCVKQVFNDVFRYGGHQLVHRRTLELAAACVRRHEEVHWEQPCASLPADHPERGCREVPAYIVEMKCYDDWKDKICNELPVGTPPMGPRGNCKKQIEEQRKAAQLGHDKYKAQCKRKAQD